MMVDGDLDVKTKKVMTSTNLKKTSTSVRKKTMRMPLLLLMMTNNRDLLQSIITKLFVNKNLVISNSNSNNNLKSITIVVSNKKINYSNFIVLHSHLHRILILHNPVLRITSGNHSNRLISKNSPTLECKPLVTNTSNATTSSSPSSHGGSPATPRHRICLFATRSE